MKLDLYARVSTDDQNVQQQMNYLRQWCIKNGHQIGLEVFDEQSGKVDLKDRIKFQDLLKNPKGDGLLVFNLDRLTRNWDSVTFIEKHFRDNWKNYKLISTKDEINLETAAGRLMFRIKLAINCHMPEDMLEKMAIGVERAKKEGKYLGRKKGALGKSKNFPLDTINTSNKENK